MLSWSSDSDPYGMRFPRPAGFGSPPVSSPALPWSGDHAPGGLTWPGQVCALCGHDAASDTSGEAEPEPGPVNATFRLGPRKPLPPVTSWIMGRACPVPPVSEGIPHPAGFASSPVSSPGTPGPVSGRPLSFATPAAAWSGDHLPAGLTWLGQVCPLCGHDAGTRAGEDPGSKAASEAERQDPER